MVFSLFFFDCIFINLFTQMLATECCLIALEAPASLFTHRHVLPNHPCWNKNTIAAKYTL